MGRALGTPEERYRTLVATLLGEPGVEPPSGRGFGSGALRTRGKIFAMLSSRDEFVVKLPRQRVAALVAAGDGVPFDPGHGRVMREWLVVVAASDDAWVSLAREALTFVSASSR